MPPPFLSKTFIPPHTLAPYFSNTDTYLGTAEHVFPFNGIHSLRHCNF